MFFHFLLFPVSRARVNGGSSILTSWFVVSFVLAFSSLLTVPLFSTQVFAQAAHGAVKLSPHRAVYDISLDHASVGSGISDMSGRMVYELSGNACDGYTQNMRFVTKITDRNGVMQINDLRSSSWEGGMAERLRFHLSQYRNDRLTDSTEGSASRGKGKKGAVDVQLEKPHRKGFAIENDVYFPMQHSIALIQAAKKGKSHLTARVYDGSEKGEKVYWASAYIGKQLPSHMKLVTAKVNKVLSAQSISAWPVSISFFEPGGEHTDAVPAYELSFRFMENGISTRLHIDYGDFAVRGELRELSLLAQADCHKGRRSN